MSAPWVGLHKNEAEVNMKLRAHAAVRQCYALHSSGEKLNLSKRVAWSKLACTIIFVTRDICWTTIKILYDQHTNDLKKD